MKEHKNEILWNIVNSILAGGLVFLGAFIDGQITWTEVIASIGASGVVVLTKFKEYWDGEKKEFSSMVFKFV